MTIYYQSKETVFSQKVEVQLHDFNNQLAIEKQHTENQRLLYAQQLAQGRLQIFMVVGAFLILLLVLLIFFLVFQHRQRQKTHRIADQLDQSNKVLKRFISILGHDLRSPFNAILGFTDLLKNDPDLTHDERELAIDKLYSSSRTTFKLLESILEWSLLESGSIKPVFKSCDLAELIRETILVQEPAATMKKIGIRYPGPGPIPIQADHDMVRAAIRNILSNAVKFTNPGGWVKIEVTSNDLDVQIEISDNGIGIPPDQLARLFRPDENYKSKGTAGEEGSGLGLTLCREYIGLHKGSLTVTSKTDSGSVFTISLPLKQVG
jgi:signal transduction histidine kinase